VARLVAFLPHCSDAIDAVVLRWKEGAARDRVEAARRVASLEPRPSILLSDRLDLARASGLEGVQLPEDGAKPGALRRLWPEALLGASRHDEAGLVRRSAHADFVLLSPVFGTPSKPDAVPLGLERFATLVKQAPCPALALGGITAGRAGELLAAGAAGVAVRGAVFDDADPVARVRELRAALDSAAAALPDDQFVAWPDRRVRPE
jgi:thiamine-phosphate diphosphorylase